MIAVSWLSRTSSDFKPNYANHYVKVSCTFHESEYGYGKITISGLGNTALQKLYGNVDSYSELQNIAGSLSAPINIDSLKAEGFKEVEVN